MVKINAALFAAALASAFASPLASSAVAQTVELKLAHHISPQHPMSVFLQKWADQVGAESNGRLKVSVFPSQQMGPADRNFRMVETGVADISWLLHGLTSDLFPLTGLADLPFTVGSAEIGAKVLNDPALLDKYLAPEHKGMKVLWLFTSPPGNLNMANVKVDSVSALQGKRIRFPSRTIRDYISALGATPQAMRPTEMLEALQKGTVDGVFIDWGGAGLAFKLGPYVKYTTELHAYVSTMCICMNKASYDRLPADLKAIFDKTIAGRQAEIGKLWDDAEGVGKSVMLKDGTEAVRVPDAEMEKFRTAGRKVSDDHIAALAKRGLPAKEAYGLMTALAAKYAQTSRSFWK